MTKLLAAAAAGATLLFTLPAFAADSQACQASWLKLDPDGTGYAMADNAASQMAAARAANLRTAREDRMTAQEYMEACSRDLFTNK